MDLRKLPPSMLLTLGLACGDGKGSEDTSTVNACLSPPSSETDTGSTSVGPCLDVDPVTTGELTSTGSGSGSSSSGADSTIGPCLSPEPPDTTGTDTGSGSGTDTGTGTDTEGTTGMMVDDSPSSRAAAVERVLSRGTLPADVAARLRDRGPRR